MALYRLSENAIVIRTSDGANIPNSPDNLDRIEYEAWLAAGGVPDPYAKSQTEIDSELRWISLNADATRADLLVRLRTATPAQINAYVDSNVTNLAEARTLLKKVLLVLAST